MTSNAVDFHSQLNMKPWGMFHKARSASGSLGHLQRITHSCERQNMCCLIKAINGPIIIISLHQWRDYYWIFFLFASQTSNFFRYVIATAIINHLWECSEGRRLSAEPCDFTISQLTSSLKWHWLTCLLLPLISTVHASALWEVFIISLNSTGFIAKGCLSLGYSRERRVIFFPISTFYC